MEPKNMPIGIVLIAAGLLIALHPPLLAIVVACVLVLLGSLILVSAVYHRQLNRWGYNRLIELILRY